jgi:hypothetical protein
MAISAAARALRGECPGLSPLMGTEADFEDSEADEIRGGRTVQTAQVQEKQRAGATRLEPAASGVTVLNRWIATTRPQTGPRSHWAPDPSWCPKRAETRRIGPNL